MRFKAEDKAFMNNWNMKQVIFIEGTLEITMRLEGLIKVVHSSDLIPKISPEDLGKVRVLNESEPDCQALHNKLVDINNSFNTGIKQLVMPLRFSILALLSARKCTVFDESIVKLIDYILDLKYEGAHIYRMAKVGEQDALSSLEEKVFSATYDGNEVYL